MRLWLLDADVIIKFLEIDVLDKLAGLHELHVASSVIAEVKFYRRSGEKISVDFRQEYVTPGRVVESAAAVDEIGTVLKQLPLLKREAIHIGELESLAILVREQGLTLCTFDAAAIRTLPFLGVAERAVSAEHLLNLSGLTLSSKHNFDVRLSEAYFNSNLDEGKKDFIYSMGKER